MRFDSRHYRPPVYSKDRDQVVPWGPPRALRSYDGVGLAERGPRRAEGPLSGWNKFGPESYIDSDSLVSGRDSDESNATALTTSIVRSRENAIALKLAVD